MSFSLSKKAVTGWLLSILCMIIPFVTLNSSSVFTPQQILFISITLFFIMTTAFELFDMFTIGILLPFAYLLFGVSDYGTIFNAWTTNTPWMILLAYVSANALTRIGLMNRIVYTLLIKFGGSYKKIIFGFIIAGIILELLTSSKQHLLIATVAFSFCQSLNLIGTRTGTGLFAAAAIGSVGASACIYTVGMTGMSVRLMQAVVPDVSISYASYFMQTLPNLIFLLLLGLVIPLVFKQDVQFDGKDVLKEKLAALGPMSLSEKKGAVITILAILYICTTGIHKMDLIYGFVFWAIALFMPGIKIGVAEDVKNMNLGMILFVTAFIGLGSVATQLEIGKLVVSFILPVLNNLNETGFLATIFISAFGLNFLMTPLATLAAMTTPLTELAVAMGIDPLAVYYTFQAGVEEVIFPYEYAKYLLFFGFGVMSMKDFVKIFTVKAILRFAFLLLIIIPYWKLIGLI